MEDKNVPARRRRKLAPNKHHGPKSTHVYVNVNLMVEKDSITVLSIQVLSSAHMTACRQVSGLGWEVEVVEVAGL